MKQFKIRQIISTYLPFCCFKSPLIERNKYFHLNLPALIPCMGEGGQNAETSINKAGVQYSLSFSKHNVYCLKEKCAPCFSNNELNVYMAKQKSFKCSAFPYFGMKDFQNHLMTFIITLYFQKNK